MSVLLGNGDGTFRLAVNYDTGVGPDGVAVGDFNGDGKADLAVANVINNNVSVLLGNGDGTFQAVVDYGVGAYPHCVAVGDFNGDGKADLAVGNNDNSISVLLGNGDGTFQAAVNYGVGATPNGVAVGDFNGDGKADLAAANGKNVSVLLGNGDGTFQTAVNYAVGTGAWSVAAGDLNGDTKADLVVANYSTSNVSVLLGNGDGTFQTAVNYGVGAGGLVYVALGDFNGDGKVDLAVADLGDNNVSVLLGNGNGTFQAAVNSGAIAGARSIAVGDFNGDGRTDLAVAGSNGVSVLLGARPAHTISGRVILSGAGLSGVTVALSGSANNWINTDSSGNYSFSGVIADGNYVITPSRSVYGFSPPSQTFNNLSGNQTANFSASLTGVPALQFYPLTPCRVADTRSWAGFTGALGPPSLAKTSSRSFPVLASACWVPASAVAYSLNITAVPTKGYLGYLTAWPAGQGLPIASTLNSWTGVIKANAAIVPAGTNGEISIYVSDATDVFMDINGYFAPPGSSGLQFYPVTSCRVADTRSWAGFTGQLGPPSLTAKSSRSFPVLSSSCGIPSSAVAYALNITAVPTNSLIYLTTWPSGQSVPVASTLNSWDGMITANAAIVPAGTGGAVSVYVSNPTDVFLDVNGYFGPATGGNELVPDPTRWSGKQPMLSP